MSRRIVFSPTGKNSKTSIAKQSNRLSRVLPATLSQHLSETICSVLHQIWGGQESLQLQYHIQPAGANQWSISEAEASFQFVCLHVFT